MSTRGRFAARVVVVGVLVFGMSSLAQACHQGGGTNHVGRGNKKAGTPPDPAKILKRWDANGDGKVTRDEFMAAHQAGAQKRGASAPSQEMIAKRFAAMDTNGDGAIALYELKAAFAKRAEQRGARHGDKNRATGGTATTTDNAAGKQ